MRNLFAGFAIGGLSLFCSLTFAGELEIRYDDGTSEANYYAVSAGNAYAVKFAAPFYPCTLLAAKCFATDNGDPTAPFQVVILDDGGPGGAPGCTLTTVDFVSADTGNIWVEVDLPDTSSLLFIDSASFYVAMYWYTPYNPSLGGDIQYTGGDTLSWRLYSGIWYNLGGLVDLMIRAIVSHPDSLPPSFSGTTGLEDTTSCGPFSIRSIIVDDWTGVDPYNVFLFWRTNTVLWDSVNMFPVGLDTFEVVTPSFAEGDSVWYYLRASDLAGNISTDPSNAPDSSFPFVIIAEPPQFSSTTIWLDTSFPGPYSIVTYIWDNGSGLDTTRISLYWCFNEGAWNDTSMIWFSSAQRAHGQIPDVPSPAETTRVDYYVEAYDLIELRGTDPEGAPEESTYHFLYTPGPGVEETARINQLTMTNDQLLHAFPNPFTSTTTIQYHLTGGHGDAVTGRNLSTYELINLSIYDLAGTFVCTLVDSEQQAGPYTVVWDGSDAAGRAVSAGVYFYRLQAGEFTATKKLVVLK